jgi:hypothetical protein
MPINTNSYWLKLDGIHDDPDRNVYICVDDPWMKRPDGVAEFIGVQCEPNAIHNSRNDYIQNHLNFDMLLTFDDEILKNCPNSKLCLYGTTWIPKEFYENIDTHRKLPKISNLTGWKDITDGHRFRRHLYINQKLIDLPIDWFRSGAGNILPEIKINPILGTGKETLFLDYQYSLVIENSRQLNYFTEKLIDCLITKTIPIYYGCPNIDQWFDTSGWIILESPHLEELTKCTNIDLNEHYKNNVNTIEHNFNESKKYIDYTRNIFNLLNIKTHIVTFVSDSKYFDKFIKSCDQLITNGKYVGLVCLVITDDLVNSSYLNCDFIRNNNIIIKHFPDMIFPDNVKTLEGSSKLAQYHKFYLFDVFFKQWDYVLYIDCGMNIYSDISPILHNAENNALLAHSDAYPLYEWKLSCQFSKAEPYYTQLSNLYNLDIDYFQTTIMFYDTSIIKTNTFQNLYDLMYTYPISITNDQGILSLYFTVIYNKWKQIKVEDNETMFYDYLRRNFSKPYLMLKCV